MQGEVALDGVIDHAVKGRIAGGQVGEEEALLWQVGLRELRVMLGDGGHVAVKIGQANRLGLRGRLGDLRPLHRLACASISIGSGGAI